MVRGSQYLFILGRARGRSSKAASLTSGASVAWQREWWHGITRCLSYNGDLLPISCTGVPSTSCSADQSSALPGELSSPHRRLLCTNIRNENLRRHEISACPLLSSSCSALPPYSAPLSPTVRLLSCRALHACASTAMPAAGDSREHSTRGSASSESSTAAAPSSSSLGSGPVQNPLQAALDTASGIRSAVGQLGQGGRSVRGRHRQKRTWVWYDEADERQERIYERAKEQYTNVGTAFMGNIIQSVKKLNRIVRLVRGLSYEDAVAQCKMVPHKAARYVVQALEAAYQDATQSVGLDGEKLVVGIIYATRGSVEKGMQRMGRGRSGKMFTRTSHLRVVLREVRKGLSPSAFTMRRVAPLMSVMTGSNVPLAPWLAQDPAVMRAVAQRPRFAYRVEV